MIKQTTLVLLLTAMASPVYAQAYGSLANFDVVNDTGSTAHGFEIDIEGIHSTDISSLFGSASRWPKMERYGNPVVTDTATGVKIVYQATLNGNSWSAGTPSGTLPVSPSDSCWPYGAPAYGPNYPCDHFGVSTGVATPVVNYYWLVEATPGSTSLIPVASTVPNPQFTVTPVAPVANVPQNPIVNVAIAAPKPNAYEFGEPRWVKVTATGTLKDVAVEDLVAENAILKKANTQTQLEWQLLQVDAGSPGSGQIDLTGVALDPGATGVVYRFEFYQYTGQRDPQTNEALVGANGDTPGANGPSPGDLGKFIVAQNAAINFDGKIPPAPPIPIAPTIKSSIAGAVVNSPYSQVISATPGNAGDTLSYTVTGLPTGLTFNTLTNTIVGTPTVVTNASITITATDVTNGSQTTATTQLQVADAPMVLKASFPVATINWPYSDTFTATGGYGAINYSLYGSLPAGLSLTGNTLTGKPTTLGTYPLTVIATDSLNYTQVSPSLNLVVGTTCTGSNTIASGFTGKPLVSFDINGGLANGGQTVTLPVVTARTLKAPLTTANAYTAGNLVTFTGSMDATHTHCNATKVTIAKGLTLPSISLANGKVGKAYPAIVVNPTGGITPYTIGITGLPSGLNYAAGKISGIPTIAGTYSVGFSVSDSNGQKVVFNSALVIK